MDDAFLLQLCQADIRDQARLVRGEISDELYNERAGGRSRHLLNLVRRAGWPSVYDAWLIAQHTPDIASMKELQQALSKAASLGVAPRWQAAQLEDRVRILEGLPQRYGTQYWIVEGVVVRHPVEDEAGLDQRRQEVGLGPADEEQGIVRQQSD